jgi:uncharacterized membrane protein YhaH (DUF805 family)
MNARQERQWYWIGCACGYALAVVTSFLAPQRLGWVMHLIMVIFLITTAIFTGLAGRAELHHEEENRMNGRINSLLKYLQRHGALFAALSFFWLALILLLFRLHDLGLLAGLFLFIGGMLL